MGKLLSFPLAGNRSSIEQGIRPKSLNRSVAGCRHQGARLSANVLEECSQVWPRAELSGAAHSVERLGAVGAARKRTAGTLINDTRARGRTGPRTGYLRTRYTKSYRRPSFGLATLFSAPLGAKMTARWPLGPVAVTDNMSDDDASSVLRRAGREPASLP